MDILIGAIILWVVPIFVAYAIGKPKHRAGAVYGIFLGWLGVLILALLPASPAMRTAPTGLYRECPHCKEDMRRDARVCPHCRNESEPWLLEDGRWWRQIDGRWHWLNPRGGWDARVREEA